MQSPFQDAAMSDATPSHATQPQPHAWSTVLRRALIDFTIALFVFALVAGALSIPSGHAFPAPPPVELLGMVSQTAFVPALVDAAPLPPFEAPPPLYTRTLLALVFATLAAFNMAVLRHLRTAYASPRRRS